MQNDFQDEVEHISFVIDKLELALDKVDESIKKHDQDFKESKKYLWENRSEMDTMEKFSNEKIINSIVTSGEQALKQKQIIEKLIDSPYFARIDFRYEDEEEAEKFYIGRFSFTDSKKNMLIYDWRAPISSMYYDFELGKAYYVAPVGQLDGELTKKRQFKIKNSKMEYALESSLNIGDDILQKELSNTTDKKMKNIVATIQKEQNAIIRNEKAEVLVIQGVAGSGKTSIALHRIAFFLYRYRETITADNIVIISPNKVFADYISNVLPELGEEPIVELGLEDIAGELLGESLKYQKMSKIKKEVIEETDEKKIERMTYKYSLDCLHDLDKYIEYVNDNYFTPVDCTFNNFVIPKSFIEERYKTLINKTVMERFGEISINIIEKIREENRLEGSIPSRNEVMKRLISMFKFDNVLDLYKGFYDYIRRPELFVYEAELEEADIYPYLYLKIFFEGVDVNKRIQHCVIDEMQDYSPIQFAVIKKLYKGQKTILGDFGQAVNPYNFFTKEVLCEIFDNVEYVELTTSYRSTYEIIEFAKTIQYKKIDPIERHGEKVRTMQFKDSEEEIEGIESCIQEFEKSPFVSMGIVCKTREQAKSLFDKLSHRQDVHFIDSTSTKFLTGVTITSICMAKGLEFDEVLIPFVDKENYHVEFDKNLLYVACTRAMHKLTLTCNGELSDIVPKVEN